MKKELQTKNVHMIGAVVSVVRTVLKYIAVTVLTFITGAISIVCWFAFRSTLEVMLYNSSIYKYSLSAIHNFSFLLFGLGLLVFVIYSKYYFEDGKVKQKLLHHFGFITGIQLSFLLILYIVRLKF